MSRGFVDDVEVDRQDRDLFDFVLEEPENDNFIFDQSAAANAGKDGDTLKLFIGQIPKDMDEEALTPYFAEFGPIFELTIIRDKNTKIHRGMYSCGYSQFSYVYKLLLYC